MTSYKKTALALKALITAVNQSEGNKVKGPLILDAIERDGDLAELISVLHENLKWNVSHATVCRAFQRAGYKPPEWLIKKESNLSVEIYLDKQESDYVHASFMVDIHKAGDGCFLRSGVGHAFLDKLRSLGVKVRLI